MVNKTLSIILLILFFSIVAKAQIDTELKEKILADLYSNKATVVWSAVDKIIEFKLYEAIPVLEEILWDQKVPVQLSILWAMAYLNSNNTEQLAVAFIDSVDNYDSKKFFGGETKLSAKAHVNQALFYINAYSQANYVIQQLRLSPYDDKSIWLLPDLIRNNPQFEIEAKGMLLNAAENSEAYSNRFNAVIQLEKLYGAKMMPIYLKFLKNIPDSGNNYSYTRLVSFEYLCRNNYDSLENLIKEQLYEEPVTSYKLFFTDTLLSRFGSPENIEFVKNFANSDTSVQENIEFLLADFRPKEFPPNMNISQMIDSLMNITNKTFSLLWVDNETKENLLSYLENSKTAILNYDSLECKEEISQYKDKVVFEYQDSVNTTPNFVTKEGWQFLYYTAQYILDRLPEIPIETEITNYSILAEHSLWLEQNSVILTGNIGTNEAGAPPFLDSEVELSVGISASTPAGYTIKGNRIKVKLNAVVNGDVYYNELDNNGTISGTQNTPLELPLFAALPEFKSSSAGTENILVPQNGQQILQPGSYGDIQVKLNGKLIFTGGKYSINNLAAGDNNQILFQSPSEVKLAGKFDSGQGSYIGPEDTTTMSAKDIVFYVAGMNGTNGNLGATPKAAKIGISNIVKANFYVPNGTLWIRQNSEAEGSFIGKDVDVGIGVKVKLNSAF
jgi:hypothetical protein